MTMALSLALERGCLAFHLWRTDVPKTTDFDLLTASLSAHFSLVNGQKQHLPLRVFRDAQGNQLLMVLTSGRVQFRISTEIPKTEREAHAHALFDLFVQAYNSM